MEQTKRLMKYLTNQNCFDSCIMKKQWYKQKRLMKYLTNQIVFDSYIMKKQWNKQKD
jgi:hypothetical protein